MADVTKKVGTHIPSQQRSQVFKSTDLNDDGFPIAAGDVLRIRDSLGRAADSVLIQTDGSSDLELRFNSRTKIYKKQFSGAESAFWPQEFYDNMTTGQEVADTSMTPMVIGNAAGATAYSLAKEKPVLDIEISVWTSAGWIITVN